LLPLNLSVPEEHVVTETSQEVVVTDPTSKHVVARAAVEEVVAVIADEHVVACETLNDVCTVPAQDGIIARAGQHMILAVARTQDVVVTVERVAGAGVGLLPRDLGPRLLGVDPDDFRDAGRQERGEPVLSAVDLAPGAFANSVGHIHAMNDIFAQGEFHEVLEAVVSPRDRAEEVAVLVDVEAAEIGQVALVVGHRRVAIRVGQRQQDVSVSGKPLEVLDHAVAIGVEGQRRRDRVGGIAGGVEHPEYMLQVGHRRGEPACGHGNMEKLAAVRVVLQHEEHIALGAGTVQRGNVASPCPASPLMDPMIVCTTVLTDDESRLPCPAICSCLRRRRISASVEQGEAAEVS